MAAPIGNQNAAKGRRWYEALSNALTKYSSERVAVGKALEVIAMNVVEAAVEGDPAAVTEIANRLDGKAAQSVTVGGEVDNPVKVSHKVEFIGSRSAPGET
jgi:hypothetical protein